MIALLYNNLKKFRFNVDRSGKTGKPTNYR